MFCPICWIKPDIQFDIQLLQPDTLQMGVKKPDPKLDAMVNLMVSGHLAVLGWGVTVAKPMPAILQVSQAILMDGIPTIPSHGSCSVGYQGLPDFFVAHLFASSLPEFVLSSYLRRFRPTSGRRGARHPLDSPRAATMVDIPGINGGKYHVNGG